MPVFNSLTQGQSINSSPRKRGKKNIGIIIAVTVSGVILIAFLLVFFVGLIPELMKNSDDRESDADDTEGFSLVGLWTNKDLPAVVNFKSNGDVVIYNQYEKLVGTYEFDDKDEEGDITLKTGDIEFEVSGNDISIDEMGDFEKEDDEDFYVQEFIDDHRTVTPTTFPTESTTIAPETTVPAETTTTTTTYVEKESEYLKIWSFTNEIKIASLAFKEKNPDIAVEYTQIPMTNSEYQKRVQASLSTSDIPDVVVLETLFVKAYVESDMLADIGSLLPKAKEMETFQYTIDIGTYEGVTKAFSYQATPGGYFYRRSLAKEYLGTDEPDKVQEFFKDMDTMTATAATIKEKSGGNTYTISATGDWTNVYYDNRKSPWIVDGRFTVDPVIDEMMDVAKTFRENGYESGASQWDIGWFDGMKDTLADEDGNPKKVFGYFLPTWGLSYVLQSYCSGTDASGKEISTAGDWGLIPGPMSYHWGGTWVGVMDAAINKETALKFVEFATLDEQHLTNWATGVYTNEYLKAIDPTIDDMISQPAGDFVSSLKVINTITDKMGTTPAIEFLGGQNPYPIFADSALKCSGTVVQGSDDDITRGFNEPLNNYVTGYATKEEALRQFREAVASAFPQIVVE
jgi:hypothetical protein